MKQLLKDLIATTLKRFDVGVTRFGTLQKLRQNDIAVNDIELLLTFPNHQASQLLQGLCKSKSQLRQDLFALSELEFKRNGYFVDFGATNGVDLSNTYLLEKEFGWTGILAEPAKCWHDALRKSRSAHVETSCVWRDSGSVVSFNEAYFSELSTIKAFNASDSLREIRKDGKTYDVKTISLNDLLTKYNAPRQIDYLSIDTEGSEFEILSTFDFDKYRVQVITCEHNFAPIREKIFSLLTRNGYIRKFQGLSRADDWYAKIE
jgi:FkbM family methyltransferase